MLSRFDMTMMSRLPVSLLIDISGGIPRVCLIGLAFGYFVCWVFWVFWLFEMLILTTTCRLIKMVTKGGQRHWMLWSAVWQFKELNALPILDVGADEVVFVVGNGLQIADHWCYHPTRVSYDALDRQCAQRELINHGASTKEDRQDTYRF